MQNERRRFRRGFIAPPRFETSEIRWTDGIDYAAWNSESESFKWWLACLGFLRLVCTSPSLSEEDEERCRFVVLDWQAQNPLGDPALDRSWDPHAAAMRGETFCEVGSRCGDDAWLRPSLTTHMEFLADPANFQGNWNHGVDQARALIRLGGYLSHDAYRALGISRLQDALCEVVDVEGVTIEQSVHYQFYSYRQISQSLASFEADGDLQDRIAEILARQAKMPEFLAHATRPDGTWFEIGDTPAGSTRSIVGTVSQYAATQGATGPRPTRNVRVYDAGYAFGRSGWGEIRPFASESAYAIRFGPGRIIHGHNDHLSVAFVSKGHEILRDGGFHGYTNDEDRAFLRSAHSHNCVVPTDPETRFVACGSVLLSKEIERNWQIYRFETAQWSGVRYRRTFLLGFDPDVMVVFDRLLSRRPQTFEQRWHLGHDVEPWLRQDADAEIAGDGFLFRQHLPCEECRGLRSEALYSPWLSAKRWERLDPAAALKSANTGTDVRFLSSFAFGPPENGPGLRFTPTAARDEIGRVEIDGHSTFVLKADGRLYNEAAPGAAAEKRNLLSVKMTDLNAAIRRRLGKSRKTKTDELTF